MKSFWWMAIVAVLLMPVDATAQTLNCTRIDTNDMVAQTGTWVQHLWGWWVGSLNVQNNPMLAHADNYEYLLVNDPWFGSASGWAKGSTDARCLTAQGAQTAYPHADVTAHGETNSIGGLAAATIVNGTANTTFRVGPDPNGSAWVLSGSMHLLGSGPGPVSTGANVGATCANSNVAAFSIDGVDWIVIGTLQTLNGPVQINELHVGSLNEVYPCAEPCAPGHVHNATAGVWADPVSPWGGSDVSYIDLSAWSWFQVDRVTP